MEKVVLISLTVVHLSACAPFKEQGGFEDNFSSVNSVVAPPPSAKPAPQNPDSANPDNSEDQTSGNEPAGTEEEQTTEPRGEEFDGGSNTEETGPPPITRIFF